MERRSFLQAIAVGLAAAGCNVQPSVLDGNATNVHPKAINHPAYKFLKKIVDKGPVDINDYWAEFDDGTYANQYQACIDLLQKLDKIKDMHNFRQNTPEEWYASGTRDKYAYQRRVGILRIIESA